LRERGEMRRRQVPVAVVDLVEVLDQQVALARFRPKQRAYFLQSPGIDDPALRRRADFSFAFHRCPYYRAAGAGRFLTAVKLDLRDEDQATGPHRRPGFPALL